MRARRIVQRQYTMSLTALDPRLLDPESSTITISCHMSSLLTGSILGYKVLAKSKWPKGHKLLPVKTSLQGQRSKGKLEAQSSMSWKGWAPVPTPRSPFPL